MVASIPRFERLLRTFLERVRRQRPSPFLFAQSWNPPAKRRISRVRAALDRSRGLILFKTLSRGALDGLEISSSRNHRRRNIEGHSARFAGLQRTLGQVLCSHRGTAGNRETCSPTCWRRSRQDRAAANGEHRADSIHPRPLLLAGSWRSVQGPPASTSWNNCPTSPHIV